MSGGPELGPARVEIVLRSRNRTGQTRLWLEDPKFDHDQSATIITIVKFFARLIFQRKRRSQWVAVRENYTVHVKSKCTRTKGPVGMSGKRSRRFVCTDPVSQKTADKMIKKTIEQYKNYQNFLNLKVR